MWEDVHLRWMKRIVNEPLEDSDHGTLQKRHEVMDSVGECSPSDRRGASAHAPCAAGVLTRGQKARALLGAFAAFAHLSDVV